VSYSHFEQVQPPRMVRDHTSVWNQLTAIGQAGDEARNALVRFCQSKRISVEALEQLGACIARRSDIGYCLAYAGTNGNGTITAIKYRPLNGTSHASFAEEPSVWLRPIVIGNIGSLDWLIAEGETDAARLWGLVGGCCAILVLPAGARTFRPDWADVIPRGATVMLCHDADEDGDAGAEKAGQIIGGRTMRLRPPVDVGDWCEGDGDREAFMKLAAATRLGSRCEFVTFSEFAAREFPVAEPLLGEPGKVFLALGSLLMVYGADGCGKSTWTIDGIVHLAAGQDWLGLRVPRPARVCVIENEGPPSLFQQKLRDKLDGWDGPDPTPNLFVFAGPWGEFSFADADARTALREYCDQHQIDVVAANPTLGLGVGASGRPDDTQQFVDWLAECGLKSTRAFWLLHHENKARQISGDWGRHPDTKVLLQRDGNHQRTKLDWNKTRWATLDPEDKTMLLEWVTETEGYNVVRLDAVGATDQELDERINEYLTKHPCSSTREVQQNVKGTNSRISDRLKAKFDSAHGPRGAILWLPLSGATASAHEAPTQSGENPDEHWD
jgi:AAA domain